MENYCLKKCLSIVSLFCSLLFSINADCAECADCRRGYRGTNFVASNFTVNQNANFIGLKDVGGLKQILYVKLHYEP